MKGIKKRG